MLHNEKEVYSMRTPADFSKSTDVPQNNKTFLISVHEAEEVYPHSPISVREILCRARQKYAFTDAQLKELEGIIKEQEKI